MIGPYKAGPNDTPERGIYPGDARELCKAIPDQSVDLIFTDPPYVKDSIHLYEWLAEEAARILKPGGFLFAYAGVYWKWEVMRLMSQHMDYWFDMVLLNSGSSPVAWNKNVISRYKSLLVYTRPDDKPRARVMALSWFEGGGADKRGRDWWVHRVSVEAYKQTNRKPGRRPTTKE
jgi:methylase of polypeptide subunit release factors